MYILNYRKLNAYQYAKELTCAVYSIIKEFPAEERHALSDQLRRAVVSVPSNIAEGAFHKRADTLHRNRLRLIK